MLFASDFLVPYLTYNMTEYKFQHFDSEVVSTAINVAEQKKLIELLKSKLSHIQRQIFKHFFCALYVYIYIYIYIYIYHRSDHLFLVIDDFKNIGQDKNLQKGSFMRRVYFRTNFKHQVSLTIMDNHKNFKGFRIR